MNEDLFDNFSRTTYMVSTLSASNSSDLESVPERGPIHYYLSTTQSIEYQRILFTTYMWYLVNMIL